MPPRARRRKSPSPAPDPASPTGSTRSSSSLSPVRSNASEAESDAGDTPVTALEANDEDDEDAVEAAAGDTIDVGGEEEEVEEEGAREEATEEASTEDDANVAGMEEVEDNEDAEEDEDEEEEDGDEDEEEEDEGEEEEEEGEEEEGEEEEGEEADEADEDEDDEEEEEEDDDDDAQPKKVNAPSLSAPTGIKFRYPPAVEDITTVSDRERAFKTARFVGCTIDGCDCSGLEPPSGSKITIARETDDVDMNGGEDGVDEEVLRSWRTDEGWWKRCGVCGHGWEDDGGHVFEDDVPDVERRRREKVVGRIEELLQVSHLRVR